MRMKSAVLLAVIIGLSIATGAKAQIRLRTTPATAGPTKTPTATLTATNTRTPTNTRTSTPTDTPTLPALSDAFQLRYAANLAIGDSVVNMTNAGTVAGTDPAGNICANVYVFDPDENMLACCSCVVSPNGLHSYSAKSDLISNTLTPGVPTSIVIKLLATVKGSGSCDASSPTGATLAPGLRAWGTTIHALPTSPVTYGVAETEFSPAALSASELAQLTSTCGSIQTTGAGAGICTSCRLGGL